MEKKYTINAYEREIPLRRIEDIYHGVIYSENSYEEVEEVFYDEAEAREAFEKKYKFSEFRGYQNYTLMRAYLLEVCDDSGYDGLASSVVGWQDRMYEKPLEITQNEPYGVNYSNITLSNGYVINAVPYFDREGNKITYDEAIEIYGEHGIENIWKDKKYFEQIKEWVVDRLGVADYTNDMQPLLKSGEQREKDVKMETLII